MKITWFGQTCFKFSNNEVTIIVDPYDESVGLTLPDVSADIVTVSHDTLAKAKPFALPHRSWTKSEGAAKSYFAFGSDYKLLTRPGEYEIKGVFITATAIYPPDSKMTKDRSIIFTFQTGGITLCHLGNLGHIPSQQQIKALDNTDVLFVPVGGGCCLNAAQASEVINMIEPRLVIPMHYHIPKLTISLEPIDKFLKEMGLHQVERKSKLTITNSNLPIETQTIILNLEVT
ncbi:MAG: hypothetical protein B6242_13490 [Anaerolineaceae bacterium 4572_78]|nr:MAG: hypothetical protein B6242_13490 [Anaerolineaceae bacterium 4572_78]